MKTQFLALLSILVLSSCKNSDKIERENQSDIYSVASEDREMNDAIKKANETLSDFNRALSNPKAEDAALKVAFKTSEGVEHIWVSEIKYKDGQYSGILDNEPEYITQYNAGDTVKIDQSKISDWMYLVDGKLFGGYTIRVLRDRMDEEQRKQLDADSGMKID